MICKGLKFVDSDGLFLSAPLCNEMYAHAREHEENPYFSLCSDPAQCGKLSFVCLFLPYFFFF